MITKTLPTPPAAPQSTVATREFEPSRDLDESTNATERYGQILKFVARSLGIRPTDIPILASGAALLSLIVSAANAERAKPVTAEGSVFSFLYDQNMVTVTKKETPDTGTFLVIKPEFGFC